MVGVFIAGLFSDTCTTVGIPTVFYQW